MRHGIFVTGTGTGVGKTVVSAALVHRYRRPGAGARESVRYWKPVQTGIERDDDTEEVRRLGACAPHEILAAGVRLRLPLSPHLSARLAGTRIEIDALADLLAGQPVTHRWVVEGAGGVLVPLNERALMIDLMARLGLPVLVVARSGLGTINHTLLTLEALRARALSVAGVVMCGDPNPENRAAIERYGEVPVVGEMPAFLPLTPEALRAWAAERLQPSPTLEQAFA